MPQSTTVLSSRNHAGLIYLSWKEGEGALIHLWREPQTQQYGLRQIQRPDDDSVLQSCLAVHKTDVFLTAESGIWTLDLCGFQRTRLEGFFGHLSDQSAIFIIHSFR